MLLLVFDALLIGPLDPGKLVNRLPFPTTYPLHKVTPPTELLEFVGFIITLLSVPDIGRFERRLPSPTIYPLLSVTPPTEFDVELGLRIVPPVEILEFAR
jgi:hypothetical protein